MKAYGRRIVGASAIAMLSIGVVCAQSYPQRPPRLVVPYAAGGVADFMARVAGEGVQESLGVQLVIENRGGAGGNVGIEHVAKSAPDGYTLGLGCLGYVSNAVLQSKIPYDPIKDFVPIGMIGTSPSVVVVHPTLPVKTLKEFIALAKQRPNELAFGTSGPGGGSHLSVELFKAETNTQMTHIPYKGVAQAIPDLLAGRIQFMFDFLQTSLPQIKAGKLRALAVTSPQRLDTLPDVPTVAEAGVKGYEFGTWCGVIAPAGLPPAMAERLNASLNKALENPALRSRLAQQSILPTPMTQQQVAALIRADMERWRKLLREGRLQMLE
jgi:tripartite-type tricarboxylate transporter receptor subunit TctC